MIKKIVSLVVMTSFVLTMTGVFPLTLMAASISSSKATFGRLKASTPSDSVIIQFVSPTGIQTGGADTISLTFSSDFTVAPEAVANFDVGLGNSGVCSSATYTDEIISLTASATDWGVDVTGNVITFSPETDDVLTAGYCIRIEMGTAATTGGAGSASTITNGLADDDDTITIAGGFGDTGVMTVDIVDDDQVTVTATVNQTMTFDLDTSVTDSETDAPYTVPLGVLSSSSVKVSGSTDSVNMIIAEGNTNASGGMNVTVKNANGANGLVSTSTPADRIESATGTMIAGTENYGLCVASASLAGFTRATAYNTNCALNSETNAIIGLTTTTADLLTSSAPISSAHAEIVVNAAIAGATPAHTDYTDTLTFIATASY
ncbi:TPA: hypothetical protein DIC38_02660 [Candidatus Nomurabacteria bacterium]|nr:MAG: hypothetical protein O210_OD1C00001G0039 [Parcubacteria bacterium RAAC4_OD1_1]HCY26554.1 hypothetical protein [Candidatus Nomurabacteria bacterium]